MTRCYAWLVAMVGFAIATGVVIGLDGSRPLALTFLACVVVSIVGLGRAVFR